MFYCIPKASSQELTPVVPGYLWLLGRGCVSNYSKSEARKFQIHQFLIVSYSKMHHV